MQQAPVAAQADSVFAMGDGEVVNDVVYRHTDVCGACLRGRGRQEAEIHIISGTHARLPIALPYVAIANVVHQARRDGPGIAEDHAFAVIDQERRRRLTGELLRTRESIFLQTAAAKDVVLAGRAVIQASDAGVQRLRSGRREVVRSAVETVSQGGARCGGFGVEVRQRIRIRPRRIRVGWRVAHSASRIQHGNLRGGDRLRGASAGVLQNSHFVRGGRCGLRYHLILGQALSLVVAKEEQLVLQDRTTHIDAEDVPHQFGGTVGQPRFQFALLVEVVVGDGVGGPEVLITRPMKFVGAGLGDHRHLRPRGTALIRVGVAGDHAELLD